jgi:hypothetical protein
MNDEQTQKIDSEMVYYCYVCVSLTRKLKDAKARNDLEEAHITYNQMREHKTRVKYQRKHGFRN